LKPQAGIARSIRTETGDPMRPSVAANDLGEEGWERSLVREIRRRGFLWRTEQTYRAWGRRFATFLSPKTVMVAAGPEVESFLTDLAVQWRAAAATQRQALNALVFLMQEALKIDLGDISGFRRAEAGRRLPVVLTQEECARLFAAMEGTPQLMAQLAYGAGLRVSELVRLRVQAVDLERRQVMIRSGKGDKDRLTPLPERLCARMAVQLERLRKLHAEDRLLGAPGVWLPEGLERKFRGRGAKHSAGEEWRWQWFFPFARIAARSSNRPAPPPSCARRYLSKSH